MNLLLDTHILLWSVAEPVRLSEDVRDQIEDPSNSFWYSPISVWETMVLAEKGRLHFNRDIENGVRAIFECIPAQEAPLNKEVAIQSRLINLSHQDPADRFIVATALVYDLTLVTADKRIKATKDIPILFN